MPKKCTKGRIVKHSKKDEPHELTLKDDYEQEYGQITKMLGNCRVEVQNFDGKIRICHIRGAMRKKSWITIGDIVLVGLRDYEDAKGDIIMKYSETETKQLRKLGEIPTEKLNDFEGTFEDINNNMEIDFANI
jgi:translation initiation factor 1A